MDQSAGERDKAVEAHILPKANIDRMVIAALPPGSKTSIDSKVVLQYLASEMLAFVTSEADAVSKEDGRRVITSEDLIRAFRNLGLDMYADCIAGLAGLQEDTQKARSVEERHFAFSSPVSSGKRSRPSVRSFEHDLNASFAMKKYKHNALDGTDLSVVLAETAGRRESDLTNDTDDGMRPIDSDALHLEQLQVENMLAADPDLLNELDDNFLQWVATEFLGTDQRKTNASSCVLAFDHNLNDEASLIAEESDL